MSRYAILLDEPIKSDAKPAAEQVPRETREYQPEPASPAAQGSPRSQETELTIQPPHQSTGEMTSPSTNRPTAPRIRPATNPVVERPKSFYVTQRLDRWIDEAVRYLQETHGIKKADRSTVINSILDNEARWTAESLDQLVDRVIAHLTSRLTG
jgi:hypothetical protein